MDINRVFLFVLDSAGVGEAPDAAAFGDCGADTMRSISKSDKFAVPTLIRLGLPYINGIDYLPQNSKPLASVGRMTEKSVGKDTTTGHWEIGGIVSAVPMPTYPNGFPDEIIKEFERQTGRKVLCNKTYSGTEVIKDYGDEHMKTGGLIVYTSADSVFQIAAHEEIVPVEKLYEYCKIARKILTGKHSVGRVIARPFVGSSGNFTRTPNRHDFSLVPPTKTMLDVLCENGQDVISVGKIYDIFAGKGITDCHFTKGNDDGMKTVTEIAETDFHGLCFINLVDFDTLYGHRNDVDGYAYAMSRFDEWLKGFIDKMHTDDIVMITADHGCDPSFKGTDHTREYTPLICYGSAVKPVNLGTRSSFADIGATVLDIFGFNDSLHGNSFWNQIKRDL